MIEAPHTNFPIGIIVSKGRKSVLLRKGVIDGINPIIRKLIDEKSGEWCIFEIYWISSNTIDKTLDDLAKSIDGKILKREQFDDLPQYERSYIRLLIALD